MFDFKNYQWRKMAKNGEKWRWRICLFHLSNSPFRHWPPPSLLHLPLSSADRCTGDEMCVHGTCVENKKTNAKTCKCKEGWAGDLCDKATGRFKFLVYFYKILAGTRGLRPQIDMRLQQKMHQLSSSTLLYPCTYYIYQLPTHLFYQWLQQYS